mgnify:CR=1 FL=1
MSVNRLVKIVLVIALIVGLHVFFTTGAVNFYFVRILMLCCFGVMLAVSLNIINGYAGQFSIGHAGFYAIGAYASATFSVYGASALACLWMGQVECWFYCWPSLSARLRPDLPGIWLGFLLYVCEETTLPSLPSGLAK